MRLVSELGTFNPGLVLDVNWWLTGYFTIGGWDFSVREVIGNMVGLLGAFLGMRRSVWTWPVGIVGNMVLFTVFMAGSLQIVDPTQRPDMYGQAGRQVFFMLVSLYGWSRWAQSRQARRAKAAQGTVAQEGAAIIPGWATGMQLRLLLVAGGVIYAASYVVLNWLGSWGPAADAWVFTGSILATYSMARGWSDFWLIWIAVDAVGVPLLLRADYYPSALLYGIYGVFCAWGLLVWWRAERDAHIDLDVSKPAGTAEAANSSEDRTPEDHGSEDHFAEESSPVPSEGILLKS